MKEQQGITLIALIVTITVLIILATVTIAAVVNQNGVITKTKETVLDARAASVEEARDNWVTETLLKQDLGDANIKSLESLLDELVGKGDLTQEEKATILSESNTEKEVTIGKRTISFKLDIRVVTPEPEPDPTPDPDPEPNPTPEGVPIPDGFYYVGGEEETGVVISDNKEDENKGDSHEVAQTLKGNQFVWIPVDNPNEMFGTSSGANVGKLYEFKAGQAPSVITKGLFTDYREPAVVSKYDGKLIYGSTDVTKSNLQKEFDAMVTSVKKYKGFFLGRYEAGWDNDKLTSKTQNTAISDKTWFKLYRAAKASYPNDETNKRGAISQMVWGSQWDAALRWFNTFPELKDDNYVTDSKTPGKGHYASTVYANPIPTGSNEAYKVKNIYDMAGNREEQTLEANTDEYRVGRGGTCQSTYIGKKSSVSMRNIYKPNDHMEGIFSTRLALYVK